jgi:hypothetical protein
MRQRDPQLDSYWGTICTPLELSAPDGKDRLNLDTGGEINVGIFYNFPTWRIEILSNI